MTEEQHISVIETTANTLRGMTMDPRIPEETKAAMRDLIIHLDEAERDLLEKFEDS